MDANSNSLFRPVLSSSATPWLIDANQTGMSSNMARFKGAPVSGVESEHCRKQIPVQGEFSLPPFNVFERSSGPDIHGTRRLNASLLHAPKKKRVRTTFSRRQIAGLEEKFKQHQYIGVKEKTELADKLHLTPKNVTIWFQNNRAKLKKQNPEIAFIDRVQSITPVKEQQTPTTAASNEQTGVRRHMAMPLQPSVPGFNCWPEPLQPGYAYSHLGFYNPEQFQTGYDGAGKAFQNTGIWQQQNKKVFY